MRSLEVEEFAEGLVERIREVINMKSWTIAEAEEKAGISRRSLNNVLYGLCIPSTATTWKMCRGWDISADWLLGLSEEGGPTE